MVVEAVLVVVEAVPVVVEAVLVVVVAVHAVAGVHGVVAHCLARLLVPACLRVGPLAYPFGLLLPCAREQSCHRDVGERCLCWQRGPRKKMNESGLMSPFCAVLAFSQFAFHGIPGLGTQAAHKQVCSVHCNDRSTY